MVIVTLDILSGILQGDILTSFYLLSSFTMSLDAGREKGLPINPRRSRCHPSVHVTDLDFADDLSITSDTVQNAEELLRAFEEAAALVGLHCKTSKSEFISNSNDASVKSSMGNVLKCVDNLKYFCSRIMLAKDPER